MTILITGSSGKTASFLALQLTSSGHAILVASRSPKSNALNSTARFDWLDESTWTLPFSHERAKTSPIRAVYLVAPDLDEARRKVIPFVKFAMQKGVKRFVLLSAWENPEGGPLLGEAHAGLKALGEDGVEWAVLRPQFFMENFSEGYHLRTIKTEDKIYTAAQDGKKPFISARDIAAVARQTLIDGKLHNTDYIITGCESLSYGDAARILSAVLGRKIELVQLSRDEFRDMMLKEGMNETMSEYMADLDIRVSKGLGWDPIDNVKALTGHNPRTFREFAEDNKAIWMP